MAVNGVSIAFGGTALAESPTWTRIDSGVANVSVQRWEIRRGRPTERDKTGTGTATIFGKDLSGVLDPTNTGGTFYGKLEPLKPVAIALQNPTSGTWSTLFRGNVGDWDYDLDVSERFCNFEVSCVDALDILSDAEVIPGNAGTAVPSGSEGDVFYASQQVDDRIRAALADAALSAGVTEWPAGLMTIFSGNVLVQDTVYSPRTPIIQVIDDACDAEFPGVSNRYVSKDGIVTFHGRYARFNTAATAYGIQTWKAGDTAAFVSDSTTCPISSLSFVRGKTNLINAALATPNGVADADIEGQFVAGTVSINTYGARSVAFENLIVEQGDEAGTPLTDLQETKQYATYYVDNYQTPRTRAKQIVIRPYGTSGARATAQWALVCGVELGDVISLKTTHPGGGGFNEDFFVEGLTYEAGARNASQLDVTLTIDLSPKAYYDTDPFSGHP